MIYLPLHPLQPSLQDPFLLSGLGTNIHQYGETTRVNHFLIRLAKSCVHPDEEEEEEHWRDREDEEEKENAVEDEGEF